MNVCTKVGIIFQLKNRTESELIVNMWVGSLKQIKKLSEIYAVVIYVPSVGCKIVSIFQEKLRFRTPPPKKKGNIILRDKN